MVENRQWPGVYTPEVSAPPVIARLERPAAGFIGAAATGPVDSASPELAGLAAFEAIYGPPGGGEAAHLWHAARAYFAQGGQRLHVVRITGPAAAAATAGLAALAAVAEVGVVAAPGLDEAAEALIAHAEATGGFALIDAPADLSIAALRAWRRRFETKDAALCHPWLVTDDGAHVPPSGFVAGILDGLPCWKAPANIMIEGAAPARMITAAEADVLNVEGINTIRAFPGRGTRLWGARTMSSDPEWRYVPVRRTVRWIEASIAAGLGWVAFEANGEACWARVRGAVASFLLACWRDGALIGAKPEEAFFVRCDRTTTTQADIDEGRLVCEIGVAPVRPAEFIIIRLTQMTTRPAD